MPFIRVSWKSMSSRKRLTWITQREATAPINVMATVPGSRK